jgi:hypothetical protein
MDLSWYMGIMCDNDQSDSSDGDEFSECSVHSEDLPNMTPGDETLDTTHYLGCTDCHDAPIGKGFDSVEVALNLKRDSELAEMEMDPGPSASKRPRDVGCNHTDPEMETDPGPSALKRPRDVGRNNTDPCGPIDAYIPIDSEDGLTWKRNSPSPTPSVHNPPPVTRSELCWLCTFCNDVIAKEVTLFIASNIATIDTLHMASQIKDEILTLYPKAKGARKRDILRHIREHMLHPNVKMASIIRSLITVAESLRTSIHQQDPESDNVIMDLKSIDMYLKVLTQIANAYKMDSNKLLFATAKP